MLLLPEALRAVAGPAFLQLTMKSHGIVIVGDHETKRRTYVGEGPKIKSR